MGVESITCENCGRSIGALETVHAWQEHRVCSQCYAHLSATVAPTYAAPIPGPGPMTNNNLLLAALPHIGALVGLGFIILPLVLMFAAADEFVRANAREALNFHITLFIYFLVSGLLCLILIGFVLVTALVIFMFVASIIATVKASQGQLYRYPMTIRMVN